jgi:hypothetical protein
MAKEMKAAVYAQMPPTDQMVAAGFGFPDLIDYAQKAVDLLQAHGDEVVDLLRTGFRLWTAISGRDLMGIMLELNKATVDVQKLIAAIRNEFGLGE